MSLPIPAAPSTFEIEHVIPEDEVTDRAYRLLDHLVAAGEDPVGLDGSDFAPIVVKMRVQSLIHEALEFGIMPGEPRWHLTERGEGRVIFPFAQAADAVMFRIAVL